ncbi:hypothetical protein QQZ08_006235 [Neonectria magnoliae]|uniref:Uncharacterized protein n=1 Tax=Neonectria magnoliae TaxID=2732573 RepID=A0ABR1I1A6_9HYPO
MAIVWNGVNVVQGSQCIYVMFYAIFPSIASILNTMGEGSALTTGGMVGFVIFWLITCAFLVIPVPKMRVLVYVELVVFIRGTATGSEKAWLIVQSPMLGAANCATFASNAADFQRYAKRKNDVLAGNLFGFPVSNLVVAIFGNLVCASSQIIFEELIWNPVTLLVTIQTVKNTSAHRAGCFFIAVRGRFFVCAILLFAINPWYLLVWLFISFMASYQIFLPAITGVLLVNYYLIIRGQIHIRDCFSSANTGFYYYIHGWNVRAYVAYVIGIIPNFYGFLNNMGVSAPLGITQFYFFAYWVGLALSRLSF